MREYETVYILDPVMTETDVKSSIDKTIELIGRHGGTIFRLQNMGKKTLAYLVKKQSKGYYVDIDYCGDSSTVTEMEHGFRLDERVLRYLTVKLDEKVDVEARKTQLIEEAEMFAKALAEKQAALNTPVASPASPVTPVIEEVQNA